MDDHLSKALGATSDDFPENVYSEISIQMHRKTLGAEPFFRLISKFLANCPNSNSIACFILRI